MNITIQRHSKLIVAALALLLSVTSGLGNPLSAKLADAGGEHRLIVGLATTSSCISTWWHGLPTSSSSLDLLRTSDGTCSGTNTSAYTNVYWQSYHYSGSSMYVEAISHTGTCTGIDVRVYDAVSWNSLGNYWWVHVAPYITPGDYWYAAANNGWTIESVAFVTPSENQECRNAGLWTDPHLHQGGDNSGGTALYRNTGLSNPISPTGDTTWNWVNRYSW